MKNYFSEFVRCFRPCSVGCSVLGIGSDLSGPEREDSAHCEGHSAYRPPAEGATASGRGCRGLQLTQRRHHRVLHLLHIPRRERAGQGATALSLPLIPRSNHVVIVGDRLYFEQALCEGDQHWPGGGQTGLHSPLRQEVGLFALSLFGNLFN